MDFDDFTVGAICRILQRGVMVYVRRVTDHELIWEGWAIDGFDNEMKVKGIEIVDNDIVRLYV